MATVTTIPLYRDQHLLVIKLCVIPDRPLIHFWVQHEEYKILLQWTSSSLSGSTVHCSDNFEELMASFRHNLLNGLWGCTDIEAATRVILDLMTLALVERFDNRKSTDGKSSPCSDWFYILSQIGWSRILDVASDGSWVCIVVKLDRSEHQISIQRLPGFFEISSSSLSVLHACRLEFDDWATAIHTIDDMVLKIDTFMQFFVQLSRELCCIVHPGGFGVRVFTGKYVADCRLTLSENVGLHISFEQIYSVGSDRLKLPVEGLSQPELAAWRRHFNVHVTICAICSEIWLDYVPPLVCCQSCSSSFHDSCCREWMMVDPTSKRIFSRLTGKCPACDASLEISTTPPEIAKVPIAQSAV